MGKDFWRDSAGIVAILKSGPVTAMVGDATARVAGAVDSELAALPDSQGVEARHTVLTTDRAHGVVGVPARFQASNGVLTRGASACGLEVHS